VSNKKLQKKMQQFVKMGKTEAFQTGAQVQLEKPPGQWNAPYLQALPDIF